MHWSHPIKIQWILFLSFLGGGGSLYHIVSIVCNYLHSHIYDTTHNFEKGDPVDLGKTRKTAAAIGEDGLGGLVLSSWDPFGKFKTTAELTLPLQLLGDKFSDWRGMRKRKEINTRLIFKSRNLSNIFQCIPLLKVTHLITEWCFSRLLKSKSSPYVWCSSSYPQWKNNTKGTRTPS